jgi:hypothetical protein
VVLRVSFYSLPSENDPPFVKPTMIDVPHLHRLNVAESQELDVFGGKHEAYYGLWK